MDAPREVAAGGIKSRISAGVRAASGRSDGEFRAISNALVDNGPGYSPEVVQKNKMIHNLREGFDKATQVECAMCHSEPGLLFAIVKDEANPAVHLVGRQGAVLKMVPPQSHIIREVGHTGASPGEADHLCAAVGLPAIVGSGAWAAVGLA